MTLWLTMLGAGVVTFAIRLSFIGAAGRYDAPLWLGRMLRFVPVAALSALIWPDLMMTAGGASLTHPRLAAGIIAALIAWRTHDILLTIGSGMLSLWLLQWIAS